MAILRGRKTLRITGFPGTFEVRGLANAPGGREVPLKPGELREDQITLALVATQPAGPVKNWVPFYLFHILSVKTGRKAGEIHLRIGNTERLRLYGGARRLQCSA